MLKCTGRKVGYTMKKFFALVLICLFSTLLLSCSSEDTSIVGKWVDEETQTICEYTSDGYYYELVNEQFTADKTKYTAKGGKITYYIEGESPDTGFSVKYEIRDSNLIINDTIIYTPIEYDFDAGVKE